MPARRRVSQTRRYPSLASHERPGDSLKGDEKATISDRTRRDGQRFARRVHACMSWYTMIYDNIGPTPGTDRGKGTESAYAAFFRGIIERRSLPAYYTCLLPAGSFQVLVEYSNPSA